MNRLKNLASAESEEFDICIIGGGATGVGCALDAALRGLKVVLIERDDFAAATSSRSTKLFHGGVRYLEQAVKKLDIQQFKMVYKALKERRALINNAPHLAQPLALLTPCYSWFAGVYYAIGLKIYDLLAGSTNLAKSDWLSKKQAAERIPQLNVSKISSAVLYYDGQFDDTRYTLALAKTATEHGAVVLNHVEALSFEKNTEGGLSALQARDILGNGTLQIRAKQFINAILPRDLMTGDTAILIPETEDGRVIFIIPWQRRLLVGTTDEEVALTNDDILLEKDDIAYLLKYVNRYFTKEVTPEQVRSGFGGLRPLLQADPNADAKSLVRDHEVEYDKTSGLVSIMGGKWTTYRLMAKDTVDFCEQILRGAVSECKTENQLLIGGEDWDHDAYKKLARRYGVPEYVTRRLNRRYGSDAHKVLSMIWKDPSLRKPVIDGSPILKAEVVFAVTEEMGCTLRDVMSRRLGMEFTDWEQTYSAADTVARVMQEVMWFSSEDRDKMVADYRAFLKSMAETAGYDLENHQFVKSS
jgi:glycerol-3-phosphate dehydrogenase